MKLMRKPSIILLVLLLCATMSMVLVQQNRIAIAEQRQEALNNALLAAIPNNHISTVRDLLRKGADPNSCEQPTTLKEKMERDYPIVRHLFPSDSQPIYFTALGLAVLNTEPETVQALLGAGADVEQRDNVGETALDMDANCPDKISSMLKKAAVIRDLFPHHALKGTARVLLGYSAQTPRTHRFAGLR